MSGAAWKRSDSIRLGGEAMKAGLATYGEAEGALLIGARMLAHGFTSRDIDQMVQDHYARATGYMMMRPGFTDRQNGLGNPENNPRMRVEPGPTMHQPEPRGGDDAG